MSSYSLFERAIARFLGRFPILKRFAKKMYSRLAYVKNKKSYRYKTDHHLMKLSIGQSSGFFGYYDKSPENDRGWVIVCAPSGDTSVPPSSLRSIDLVVLDENQEVILLKEVKAYNWQQACRAHWISDDLLIYNDVNEKEGCYVSCVVSVTTGQVIKTFGYPVQDSYLTSYFISINYQRLMALRPDYGYRNLPSLGVLELHDLEGDGLWKVDYDTGDSSLLVSLAQVCKVETKTEFSRAVHKLNHVMISPDGQKFIFMHRYLINERRFDRLFLANAETGELTLLADYGMVSHCFWADENTILGYLRGPGNKDAYWLVDIHTARFTQLGRGELGKYGDGHPHVWGDWFVTDTYPDKARIQHLILCNWKTAEVKEVGEFFHGFEYEGESRCDLHPRFSPDGKAVYFDSVFSGKRHLYRMELGD